MFAIKFMILFELLAISRFAYSKSFNYASVFYTPENGFTIVPNVLNKTHSVAYGTYSDSVEIDGWGILEIKAGYNIQNDMMVSSYESNQIIMKAAGFLEGYLTADRIQQHATNMYEFFFINGIKSNITKEKIIQFFENQDTWMRRQIIKFQEDPLWRHAAYILAQFDGLMDGYYNATNGKAKDNKLRKATTLEFYIINNSGELLDLQTAVNPSQRPNFMAMSKEEIDNHLFKTTHCSALVKVLPGYENIYMSHSSWFTYQAMLRIFKHYDFNLDDEYTRSKAVSFSSYPGQLNSLDDFYIMSNNLVMLQTTNGILNASIYDKVTYEALFAWHRVRIANMVASNGNEWGKILSSYNSGTYNNQYMVIDLNKITLTEGISDDALWVVEQIPGLVVSNDQTDILRAGYWPSYNVPFYENIYNLSGYPEVAKKFGPEYTYQLAPRAKIFRRDQANVIDMESMKRIMRYNDYKNDIYSDNNACKTICCRGDITGNSPGGCYDTKVTDYFFGHIRGAYILNGPTTYDGNLPPFTWDKFPQIAHNGMPEIYNFSFVFTKPFL